MPRTGAGTQAMQRWLVALAIMGVTAPAAATTTLNLDDTTVAASTALWLDAGGTAPTDAPTSFASRGVFGYVVGFGDLYNHGSFHGDAFGLMSESRIMVTYTLYDVGDLPAALAAPGATVAPGTPDADAAAALYADAGSGTVYGTATVSLPTGHAGAGGGTGGDTGSAAGGPTGGSGAPPAVTIALNPAGVAAANAAGAAGRPLLIGVSTSTAPAPEPATWALLATGFGLVGGARRYRTPSTAARTASTDGRTL